LVPPFKNLSEKNQLFPVSISNFPNIGQLGRKEKGKTIFTKDSAWNRFFLQLILSYTNSRLFIPYVGDFNIIE
jgi:hypothetical protein